MVFKRSLSLLCWFIIQSYVCASFTSPLPSNEMITNHPNNNNNNNNNNNKQNKKERMRIPVLRYENDWICVNKPAGITVHRSKETWGHKLVLSTSLKRQLSRKVYPVHRLDHRTSGAILFAFDSSTCGLLHSSLRSQNAKKEYVALLRGHWYFDNEVVTVDKALKVDGVEKEACTEFHLLATFHGKGDQRMVGSDNYVPSCSLVKCIPKTGRTHQIRRHASALGFPIIGDSQHGDSKVNRWWRQNWDLDRLALHCLSLDLPSLNYENENVNENEDEDDKDFENERIKCVAPLPSELMDVLKRKELIEMWEYALKKDERLSLDAIDIRGGTFGRHYKKRRMEVNNDNE